MQRRRVQRIRRQAVARQGRQRRGKAEHGIVARVIQRLDPEPVTGQEQPARLVLANAEGEHALEFLDAALPPRMEGLQNDLGVAAGKEPVALGAQPATQLVVVVDAAVEHDGQAEFLVPHGLGAALGQVHDRQPTVAKRHRALGHETVVVGPAGAHQVQHPLHAANVGRRAVEANLAGDSTHRKSSFRARARARGQAHIPSVQE
jgi:hypothetical protein